jgi:uncharacterized membrane protein YkoI
MPESIRKTITTVAAIGALGLGGAALANAADSSSSSSSNASGTAAQAQGGAHGGRHVGANGVQEKALSADVAAKVKDAALAKLPGGTIERVETDADHGSPYEAHVTKADGTQVEVLVNADFEVTAVNEMGR